MTTKRPTTDLTSWPEGALRGCARHAERPEVRARAVAELERRAQRPWLSGAEKIIALVNLLAVFGLISIAFWLSACTFPSEGTGPVPCEDCYRPPRFPGAHIDVDPPSTEEGESSTDVAPLETGGSTSESESSSGEPADGTEEGLSESSDSSSTGDPPFDPAHCDRTCPDGDALQPTQEQAVATIPGCYCATPCESDDDCGAYEWCDPQFSRCTVYCMSDAECNPLASPPGSMTCTAWWNSADEYTHFCTYWNEDAP